MNDMAILTSKADPAPKSNEPEAELDTASLEVFNILSCKPMGPHKPSPICIFPSFQVSAPLRTQPAEQKATTVPSSPLYDQDPVHFCNSPPVRVNNPVIHDSRFLPCALERELSEDPLNDNGDEDEDAGSSDESYENDMRAYCVTRSHAVAIRRPAHMHPRAARPSAWPRLSVTC